MKSALNLYVDDLALSTAGSCRAVALLHGWASRMLTGWVTRRMRKQLALDKLVCVASSATTRAALRDSMGDIGCTITAEADFLGADYSAGGIIRKRKLLKKRLGKALLRKKRLRWWRKLGGCAREVARGGVQPSVSYGASASGLPPRAQLARRRLQAAASRIGAAGSSLTSKLAIGGANFGDVDPTVLDPNPPMGLLLQLLWDRPRLRSDFLDCWHRTSDEFAGLPPEKVWSRVRGIVSASWAHLRQLGGDWESPFRLRLLDEHVDILATSPKHVMQIMAHHARIDLDRRLVLRIAVDQGSDGDDVEAITRAYRNGIDWAAIRGALNNRDLMLTPVECKALELVVTQALWPEARRWRAGLLGHGTCMACLNDIATQPHRIRLCEGVRQHLELQRRAGRISRNLARDRLLLSLPAPLLHFGLPPRLWKWQPRVGRKIEGCLRSDQVGVFYGDGSGCAQDFVGDRQATWALTFGGRSNDSTAVTPAALYKRGALQGWHPTVPRSEVTAVIRFLDFAGVGSEYVGDCKYALDVVQAGIPPKFKSSGCADADLWRIAARALHRKGGASSFTFTKIKAHRSHAQAESEGELALAHWAGNQRADVLAKSLARRALTEGTHGKTQEDFPFPGGAGAILAETAMGAAWAIQHWPEVGKKAKAQRNGGRCGSTAPETEVGPHSLVPHDGGGWHCVDCLLVTRTSASRKSLRTTPCRGSVTAQCHDTHELRWTHGVYWCWRCGRYTIKRPRALRQPCPGAPASAAARNVLRRLREGRPPTTASYLYEAAQASTRPVCEATAGDHPSHGGPFLRINFEEEEAWAVPHEAVPGTSGAVAGNASDPSSGVARGVDLSQAVSESSVVCVGTAEGRSISPPLIRRRLVGKQSAANHVRFNTLSNVAGGGCRPPSPGSVEPPGCVDDRLLHHVCHPHHLAAVRESSAPSGRMQAEEGRDFKHDHHPHHVAHHVCRPLHLAAVRQSPSPSGRMQAEEGRDLKHGHHQRHVTLHHHHSRTPPVEQESLAADLAAHGRPAERSGSEDARRALHNGGVIPAACRPGENSPWSNRIVVSALRVAAECSLCRTPSRVTCRGCGRQLCLRCAKGRRWCNSVPHTDASAVAVAAGAERSVLPSCRVPAVASAPAAGIGDREVDTMN